MDRRLHLGAATYCSVSPRTAVPVLSWANLASVVCAIGLGSVAG
ncbi:hypothetical protein I545_6698 [Mycobacterium kansasii 662]|uniref:Uncharacterized protein n=1 Tax=Mycobacterium kansasii 662 TaxID=1299326 RepID=X7XZ60_MYCKA|nr:hypothetical protein I545_6698 [Mycobacterium kansasii 662]